MTSIIFSKNEFEQIIKIIEGAGDLYKKIDTLICNKKIEKTNNIETNILEIIIEEKLAKIFIAQNKSVFSFA